MTAVKIFDIHLSSFYEAQAANFRGKPIHAEKVVGNGTVQHAGAVVGDSDG